MTGSDSQGFIFGECFLSKPYPGRYLPTNCSFLVGFLLGCLCVCVTHKLAGINFLELMEQMTPDTWVKRTQIRYLKVLEVRSWEWISLGSNQVFSKAVLMWLSGKICLLAFLSFYRMSSFLGLWHHFFFFKFKASNLELSPSCCHVPGSHSSIILFNF